MARKRTPTLTEAELKLMRVIWDQEQATVSEVVAALPGSNRPAYNTVLTTLRILEKKGYLERTKNGRAHVYRAAVSRTQTRRKVVRHMVESFFNDSPELLVLSILENENINSQDLERLKEMVKQSERGN